MMDFFKDFFKDKKQEETESKTSGSTTGQQAYGLSPEATEYGKYLASLYGDPNAGQLNPWQTAAGNAQQGVAQGLQPYNAAASSIATTGIDPARIAQFQDPHQQQVIDATLADMEGANATENSKINANAAKMGALSGTQPLVAREMAASRQADARNQVISNLRSQGFNTAAGLAAQSTAAQTAGLNAGANLAGAQTGANQAGFGMGTTGATQRYSVANMGSQGIAGLSPASGQNTSGTTQGTSSGTNTTTGQNSPFSIMANLAGTAMTAFAPKPSDERIKTNIREIGTANNGLPIYAYNIKGSPTTELGFMAQDVEQINPDAVDERNGIKMVDYDLATSGAERSGMNTGGSVGMAPYQGGDTSAPHQKLTTAFEAIRGLLHKANGGSVMQPYHGPAKANGGAIGDWTTTVEPANQGPSAWEKTGKALQGYKQPSSIGSGPSALSGQQSALAQSLSSLSSSNMPRFDDGGVVRSWGETGPAFEDRESVLPAYSGVTRSELPSIRGARSDEALPNEGGAPWTEAERLGAVGSRTGQTSGASDVGASPWTSWLPSMPKLGDMTAAPSKDTGLRDAGLALMSVRGPLFEGPMNGAAKTILAQIDNRRQQQQVDQAAEQFKKKLAHDTAIATGKVDVNGQTMPTLASQTLDENKRLHDATIALTNKQADNEGIKINPSTGAYYSADPKSPFYPKVGEGTPNRDDVLAGIAQKEFAKDAPKMIPKAKEQYDSATDSIGKFKDLESLLPHMITGKWAGPELEGRKALRRLGYGDADKIAATEIGQALTQKLVLEATSLLKPASNLDAQFAAKATATIENDPSTLSVLLPGLRAVAARSQLKAQAEMEQYMRGRIPDYVAIDRAVDARIESPYQSYARQLDLGVRNGAPDPNAPRVLDKVGGSPKIDGMNKEQLMAMPDGPIKLNTGTYFKRNNVLYPTQGDPGSKGNPLASGWGAPDGAYFFENGKLNQRKGWGVVPVSEDE